MSGIATGTALMIAGGVGAAGSLGAAAMESNAAGNAASAERNAANYATQVQGTLGQESLANEVATQEQNKANMAPWLETGANSLASLAYLLGVNPGGTVGAGSGAPGAGGAGPRTGQTLTIPGIKGSVTIPGVTPLTGTANTRLGAMGSLMQAYPGGEFSAPTLNEARQEPGYQFALTQGEGALRAGAAANGSLLTGGALHAEDQLAQGLADATYNNVYNRAMQTYNTRYNTFANDQANRFNRLAALSGMGQTAAQTLGSQGIASAGQIGNTLMNTGREMGQNIQNAGAATASGYINSANAWGGGLSNATSGLSQLLMMQQLMNPSAGSKPKFNSQGYAVNDNGIPYYEYAG